MVRLTSVLDEDKLDLLMTKWTTASRVWLSCYPVYVCLDQTLEHQPSPKATYEGRTHWLLMNLTREHGNSAISTITVFLGTFGLEHMALSQTIPEQRKDLT
ncbi:hypothetical protein AAES_09095 [Amazona aestiva]|uniref:Uncharacterized protein n=1 Tax=Amazona aestiva TaxID=12930 RepID=A0A0Q3X9K0_AMAAE|nr:hypothetical protein AAES_09095 [Amazona aestiva]